MSFLANPVGRILFATAWVIFAINHFIAPDMLVMMAFGSVWILYAIGVFWLGAAVAVILVKRTSIVGMGLALIMVMFAIMVHVPRLFHPAHRRFQPPAEDDDRNQYCPGQLFADCW